MSDAHTLNITEEGWAASGRYFVAFICSVGGCDTRGRIKLRCADPERSPAEVRRLFDLFAERHAADA